jgi:hypothetical protein
VQVGVDLHVEVDELAPGRGLGGRAVDGQQPLDDLRHGPLEAPVGQLRDHGGDLDGHVVDVVPVQQRRGVGEVLVRLLRPEDLLAQQVDVEPVALGRQPLHGLPERLGAGVDDHVAHELAEPGPGGGDDHLGRRGGEGGPEPDLGAVRRGHGAGHDLGERVQGPPGGPHVLGAHHPVHEADGELEPVGVLQDGGEPVGGAAVPAALGGAHEPLADQGDGFVGQGAGIGDGRGVGGHGGTLLEAPPGSGAEALPRPPAASTGRQDGR